MLDLNGDTFFHRDKEVFQENINKKTSSLFTIPIPDYGYVKAINEGEGFFSTGWRFDPEIVFEHKKLITLLAGINVERLKGVIITDKGIFGYNLTQDALTEIEVNDCMVSCIEIISDQQSDSFEQDLMSCVIT